MLKGIHPAISPDLLRMLCAMGHGGEILLADIRLPRHMKNSRVLRADGLEVTTLLSGVLPIFALHVYTPPLVMIAPVPGDTLYPGVEEKYLAAIRPVCPDAAVPERIDRFAFFDRTRNAYTVVMTGETAKFGNLILKKGVTAGADS